MKRILFIYTTIESFYKFSKIIPFLFSATAIKNITISYVSALNGEMAGKFAEENFNDFRTSEDDVLVVGEGIVFLNDVRHIDFVCEKVEYAAYLVRRIMEWSAEPNKEASSLN